MKSYKKEKHKAIGKVNGEELYIEDSYDVFSNQTCPYCHKRETPKYVFSINNAIWFCGKELCLNMFIFQIMDGAKIEINGK